MLMKSLLTLTVKPHPRQGAKEGLIVCKKAYKELIGSSELWDGEFLEVKLGSLSYPPTFLLIAYHSTTVVDSGFFRDVNIV